MIEIDQIRLDGGTQARAGLNPDTVVDYAEQMEDEATVFPPVIVYHDGKDYWLSDGFHRVAAWNRIGREEIPVEVRQGDRRRAILHACGANGAHGLRRTADDKRRAVMTLLEDREWSQWTDREIARQCVVSPCTVAKYRAELSVQMDRCDTPRKVKRGDSTYTMDTSKIGASKTETSAPQPEAAASSEGQGGAAPPPASGGGDLGAAPARDGVMYEYRREDDPVFQKDEPPADPYGYADLTEEALLDLANGLRADLEEAKAELKRAKQQAEDLRRQVDSMIDASDSATVIRNQAKEIKRLNDKVWKANEDARRAIAARRRAEDRVKELEGAGVVTL